MPIHIGLVLDSKVLRSQLKKENVVDILSWCVYSGIQYITVHDHEGQLKADFTVYTEELRKRTAPLCSTKLKFLESPRQIISHKDVYLNKSQKPDMGTTYLCITSAEDGQESIVLATQKITMAVKNDTMDINSIKDYHFMNDIFSSSADGHSWPPPDFILKFGDSIVWNGFLPWQIRYSEILFVEQLNKFNVHGFIDALNRFDKCSRRFGK